jgi:hypothetical protein
MRVLFVELPQGSETAAENPEAGFDLDLWLRMVKKGCKFMSIQELLSTAPGHNGAKTTAFEDL